MKKDQQPITERTDDSLLHDLISAQEQLAMLTFKQSSNQLKNIREIRSLKKAIAQMKTVLKEHSQISPS